MTAVAAPTSRAGRRSHDGGHLARSILEPALKAYLVGYLLDLIPSLIKTILRYVGRELRRIRQLQRRARQDPSASRIGAWEDITLPAIKALPQVGKDMVDAVAAAFAPSGSASSCAAAIVGWRLIDEAICRATVKLYGQRGRSRIVAVWSCFIAASVSSGISLLVMQHAEIQNTFNKESGDRRERGVSPSQSFSNLKRAVVGRIGTSSTAQASDRSKYLPTPLAPGGHFLAKLTNLSVPVTPRGDGSRSPLPGQESQGVTSDTPQAPRFGKPSPTIDLTLFALVRGLDTLVRAAPMFVGMASVSNQRQASARVTGRARSRASLGASLASGTSKRASLRTLEASSGIVRALANQAEGVVFTICCSVIMWSWFYAPERLPPSYVKWITNLATMDERLLLALRSIRTGRPHRWEYGDHTVKPEAITLLSSLSESLGHPYEWGDPTRLPASGAEAQQMLQQARQIQKARGQEASPYILAGAAGPRGRGEMGGIPCEIVHCGVGGSSCLANAGLRWIKGWKVCMGIYVPVHLLPRLLFNPKQFTHEPLGALGKVLTGSARSASFLATYIASIW